MSNNQEKIILNGVKTHNLKNIDVSLPKNQIITITGVSGSGKSSLAFDTIYKEGQFRYIESLSSYLRQFFNLGERPDIDYSSGLSPAIAIEQNKRVGNIRSTVGTLTEIDDYLRLMFAKLGDVYCYQCGEQIKTKSIDQIIADIRDKFLADKIYILQDGQTYAEEKDFERFVRRNRKKVEGNDGFVRYMIFSESKNQSIEYFYLEEPNIPKDFFPIKVYGIFDRVTINDQKLPRLKEDIIKILSSSKKFGVYKISGDVDENLVHDNKQNINMDEIIRYTDKNFCAKCNITYPEFTTQHFSPNRQEGACEVCHGLGQTLQVDFGKLIDPFSPYMKAILPWRDSTLGQSILEKVAHKYGIDTDLLWKDIPDWFKETVINGDGELYRIGMGGKFISMYYKGISDILTQQYHKGVLSVDFQAMLDLKPCEVCGGSKLKRESLNVFLTIDEDNNNLKGKTILILHGFGGSSKGNWFPWIQKKLKDMGANVIIPDWPNPLQPKLPEIIKFLRQYEDVLDENSIIIGHSLGSNIALHLVKAMKKNIGKLMIFAPVFKLNLSFEETKELFGLPNIDEFQTVVESKIDFKAVNKLVKEKKAYLGLKDQYVNTQSKELFDDSWEVNVLEEKGHFQDKEDLYILNEVIDQDSGDRFRYNIFDLQNSPIKELIQILDKFQTKSDKSKELLDRILNPLLDRARTIQSLGLGYLTLYRGIDTLSGGEIQRLRLAKQLGNRLTGIIYVLDEPTIGLDENEIKNTINSIKKLKEIGNTIIVVEHNEEFIKNSDWVVEIGPGAGDFGGKLLFSGPYEEFLKSGTLTAQYVSGKKKIKADFDYKPSTKLIQIKKAHKHNLKNIDVNINLGSFTIITGPSGAGKTTLMYHTLFRFLDEKQKFIQGFIRLKMLQSGMSWSEIIAAPVMKKEEYEHYENLAVQEFYKEIGVDTIKGHEYINNVIYVDQTSIGKTPRSCPATFIGVFDDIRKIYAGTTEAKVIGFNTGHFSFNSSKGACPECQGYGYKKVELQFLPDTYVPCNLCNGNRYKSEILAITWHGKNISEILNMYVDDALEFFKDIHFIAEKLQLMCDIGLSYLKLGQPAHTLSGGESQRLKLVKHLLKSYKGHSVYFLDEPTVGLHPSDIEKLLKVLSKFLEKGDTILMIEHDKSLLKFADSVIRLDDGALAK